MSEEMGSRNRRTTNPSWKLLFAWPLLSLAAYAPAFDNGFLEDDYVVLERSSAALVDPLSLLEIPPETFRFTTYLSFGLLQAVAGYRSELYYLFALLVHVANVYLLWRLVRQLSADPLVSAFAAIFMAVMQNPQEAVMWPSAMNELLLGFFVLATLLFWLEGRKYFSLLSYCAALLSKESGLMILALVPLVDWWRGSRPILRRDLLLFAIPTLAFGVLFLYTSSRNALFRADLFSISWHAVPVFLQSVHRLAFPWLYLALVMVLLFKRSVSQGMNRLAAVWLSISLAPYVFLNYDVASRHLYSASLASACLLGSLAARMPKSAGRVFLAAFVTVNIGYLWLRKDRQFEVRAAPTERLISYLQQHPPGCLKLEGYRNNPWIVKLTTRLIPGWEPEMIQVAGYDGGSDDCRVRCWNNSEREWVAAVFSSRGTRGRQSPTVP